MKDTMNSLLKQWCDKLVDLQINDPLHPEFDGGIACPACGLIHGRCGDSMYPLVHMYSKTHDEKYLNAAKKVFDWTMNNCLVREGVIINDVGLNSWIGITVFTAMQLADIFIHHKNVLDADTFKKWYDAYNSQINYIFEDPLFRVDEKTSKLKTNVNYIFGKLAAMAGAYEITGNEKYKACAKETAALLKNLFFDSEGFIFGECKPAGARSKRGYGGIDVGYNVEESLGALAMYVHITGDEEMKALLVKSLKTHAKLMLPDGGWDNSWSVRNAKWTYWGSRTSDGCHVAYCAFSGEEPMFSEVAYRNLKLLENCTRGGLLYGGPMYSQNGYRPCVHHTFCHAKSLCWVLDNNLCNYEKSLIPCETDSGLTKLETAGLYIVNKGTVRATVSCYDFETVLFGHAGGGTLSMLYEKSYGPVIASGMTHYQTTEPSNMQAHRYGDGQMLTPRIEFTEDENLFVSCNDLGCTEECTDGDVVKLAVCGNLTDIHHKKADEYVLLYEFSDNKIKMHIECKNPASKFVMPIIATKDDKVTLLHNTAKIKNLTIKSNYGFDECMCNKRIFNLTPGFSAVPFEFGLKNGVLDIELEF